MNHRRHSHEPQLGSPSFLSQLVFVCTCVFVEGGEGEHQNQRWPGGLFLHSHPHQSQTHAICPAAHCPCRQPIPVSPQ